MATFTLAEIVNVTGGRAIRCTEPMHFSSLSTDTRTIEAGGLFIALRGEHYDGHKFVEVALKNGATAVLVDNEQDAADYPTIVVEDTLKAYQLLANFHRRRFNIHVVAITGSSGKTTTKEMLAAVLSSKYNVLSSEKNFNNEIGLPMTLLRLTEEHEVCVVEMGMRGLGQIKELTHIAEPTIGVVTNVGTSHIELLGSKKNIAAAKGELAESIGHDGYMVLNDDDPLVKSMAGLTKGKVVGYGIDTPSTVTAYNLRYKKDGIKFTCRWYDEVFDIFLPMIGIHNVYDALAAIATGRVLGVTSAQIRKALGGFAGIPMRQEIMNFGEFVVLNDAYNANPSSMSEAIKALGQLEGKRKIAILGDMLELGEHSKTAHEAIGRLLGEEQYDVLFTYGPESSFTAAEAMKYGVPQVISTLDKNNIAKEYARMIMNGDVVLVKGSRGMQMETIIDLWSKSIE